MKTYNKTFSINGYDSETVFVPAFKLCDVLPNAPDELHPAFIVNGKPISGFYMSKYQNVIKDGRAISQKLQDPTVNVDYNDAYSVCKCNGEGWSLCSALQWGAIALSCYKNGTLPLGNNCFGKDYSENEYVTTPASFDQGKTARVLTGSGPDSWSHDHTADGIFDLNGNVWEWVSGLCLSYGEVWVDLGDGFRAINGATGELTEVNSCPQSVKLDFRENNWVYSTTQLAKENVIHSCPLKNVTVSAEVCEKAKNLLLALALIPPTGFDQEVTFYANNGNSERFCFRGGKWSLEAQSGLFKTCLDDPPTLKGEMIGFRASFIED